MNQKMKFSPGPVRHMATSVTPRPLNLSPRTVALSASLLPPIPLYRALLRTHRQLPKEMRSLGDGYVKSEFRRHQATTEPVYIMGFLSQWKAYLDELQAQQRGEGEVRGRRLDPTVYEKMSDEQIGQLYEVMHASKGIWKTAEELAEGEESGSGSGEEGTGTGKEGT